MSVCYSKPQPAGPALSLIPLTVDALPFGPYDKIIRIWDVNTGAIGKPLEGDSGSVWSVACTPDGQRDPMTKPTASGTHFYIFYPSLHPLYASGE